MSPIGEDRRTGRPRDGETARSSASLPATASPQGRRPCSRRVYVVDTGRRGPTADDQFAAARGPLGALPRSRTSPWRSSTVTSYEFEQKKGPYLGTVLTSLCGSVMPGRRHRRR